MALLAYGPVLFNGAGFSHPDDLAVSQVQCCSFRPLVALTYQFNAQYGGWMLVNFGLHLTSAVMLCYLAGPLAGSLLAVHPLAAAAVGSVSGRSALLLACGVLCSLIMWRWSKWLAGIFGAVAVVATAGFHVSYLGTIHAAPKYWDYLWNYPATVASVLQKLFIPVGLSAEPMVVADPILAAVGVFVILAALALWCIPKYRIGAGLLILPLLAYAVVPLPNGFYEHRAYLSIAGMSILAALALRRIHRAALLVIPAFLVMSHSRAQVYSSPVTLWEDAVRQAPENGRARLNLGAAYAYQQQWTAAQREFEHAVRLIPDAPLVWRNLATLHLIRGRVGDASRVLDAQQDYLKGSHGQIR